MTSTDQQFSQIAEEAGIEGGADALRDIFRRVQATPRGTDPDAWVALAAPTASAELRAKLVAACEAAQAEELPYDPARLTALNDNLEAQSIQGFLVPQADAHQGEYIASAGQRLHWLTGFAGSAGTALMFKGRTILFVDGRYTLQAAMQFEGSAVEVRHFMEPPLAEWIVDAANDGDRIGYDPALHSVAQIDSLRKTLDGSGIELVALAENPLDQVWTDQPLPPYSPVEPHPLEYSGQSVDDKLASLGELIADAGADAAVVNQMEAVAWALNVRGADVSNTPLTQSFAVLHKDGQADFYVDRGKFTSDLETHLGNRVTVHAVELLDEGLHALGVASRKVLLDRTTSTDHIRRALEAGGANIVMGSDPTVMPRACKNNVELDGTRRAHERDAIAMCRFLRWLEETTATRDVGEMEAIDVLNGYRREIALNRGISFDTISGADNNGAIVHYRASYESERFLGQGSMYLVDSGGQYLDGTTDITRTVAIGAPTAEMKRHFTLVLQGHIAIARAVFPEKATGGQLDALARQFLWHDGLDYDHGTGHGVGSFLGVHEGPHRISPNFPGTFKPGMIVSNEPGLYITDTYGIRIENLLTVLASDHGSEDRKFLEFETLTVVPIDRNLIDVDMLSGPERAWVDNYHARVLKTVGPNLEDQDKVWLEKKTAPLGH
jgi:Xaa-Pro aminopeptidase